MGEWGHLEPNEMRVFWWSEWESLKLLKLQVERGRQSKAQPMTERGRGEAPETSLGLGGGTKSGHLSQFWREGGSGEAAYRRWGSSEF